MQKKGVEGKAMANESLLELQETALQITGQRVLGQGVAN